MPIITRKIELKIVRLTDEEYDQQWKYLYQINNTIYQAANRIYGAQNETYIEGWEKKTSNLLIYKRLCKI